MLRYKPRFMLQLKGAPVKLKPPVIPVYRNDADSLVHSNVIGPELAERCFGFHYSPSDRTKLAEVPVSSTELQACEGSHILFAGFPLTLNEIFKKHRALFAAARDAWFLREPFAKATRVSATWYLLRRSPAPDTVRESWCRQLSHCAPNEEIPAPCELAYAFVLVYSAMRLRLCENLYVRTSEITTTGERVAVGDFDDDGLGIIPTCDTDCDSDLALLTVRRL
jgi:hypothetical protein